MSNFKALIKSCGIKRVQKNINDGLQHYQQSIDKYFKKLKIYMAFSDHSGANMFNALTDLLDLFEEGAANGTPIKNITGEKVGDFAETIVNEVAGKWTDKQKEN